MSEKVYKGTENVPCFFCGIVLLIKKFRWMFNGGPVCTNCAHEKRAAGHK